MILAIDTGNTNIKLGLVDPEDIRKVELICRIPTDRIETDYGYAAKINEVLELKKIDLAAIEGIIISSVVPPVTSALKGAMKLITGLDAMILGQGLKTDLEIRLPGGVIAPDLEAAAVAAKELYPLPAIIINMGTATTVTVVNEEGAYIGGVIAPGTGTALNALVDSTALLPMVDMVAPKEAIAKDTVPAIQSGVVYGGAGSIDGIIDHFLPEMPVAPKTIVATGGLGRLICRYCRHEMTFDEELLFKGLGLIYKKNR